MIKLYGQARSRASRALWMLEELGIAYEHVPVRPYTESRALDYLRINPNGHIPALEDDGFILWESLAINLYLAEKYASAPMWPANMRDHARTYQWSLWAANEVEPRIVSIGRGLAKNPRDEVAVSAGLEQLAAAFRVLENELDGRGYLLGEEFTVADLTLAATIREPGEQGVAGIAAIELAPFPRITRWLDCCGARFANRRVALLP